MITIIYHDGSEAKPIERQKDRPTADADQDYLVNDHGAVLTSSNAFRREYRIGKSSWTFVDQAGEF